MRLSPTYLATVSCLVLASAGFAQTPTTVIKPDDKDFYDEIAVTPDGTTLVGIGRSKIKLFDLATGRESLSAYARPRNTLNTKVAFTPDGKVFALTGGDFAGANLHKFPTKDKIGFFNGGAGGELVVRFSPDGKRLLVFGTESIRCWEWEKGPDAKPLYTIAGPVNYGGRDVSPDGKLIVYLAGEKANTVYKFKSTGMAVADAVTGEVKKLIPLEVDKGGIGDAPLSLAFTKDGKTLVFGGASLRLWDWENGKELAKFPGEARIVCVSPGGKHAAFITQAGFGLLDIEAKTRLRPVAAGGGMGVSALAFTADSKHLVTAHMATKGDAAGVFKVWDVEKLVTSITPKK